MIVRHGSGFTTLLRPRKRGTEVLRYRAKRLVSTFVEKEQDNDHHLLPVHEDGHLASAPHSVELQFHALSVLSS